MGMENRARTHFWRVVKKPATAYYFNHGELQRSRLGQKIYNFPVVSNREKIMDFHVSVNSPGRQPGFAAVFCSNCLIYQFRALLRSCFLLGMPPRSQIRGGLHLQFEGVLGSVQIR